MEPTLEERLRMRDRPPCRPVLCQRWLDLTFLHWEVPAPQLQRLLPSGLTVDTFEGKAFLGLIPFAMRDVRPVWAPVVPGLSHFLETNVRTYVHLDGQGPGVWFFSLDAANRVGAWLGRHWYRLPYHFAELSIRRGAEGEIEYVGRRVGNGGATFEIKSRIQGGPGLAEPGSLEFFFIERYLLYAERGGELLRGRVWHEPYRIAPASAEVAHEGLLAANGVARPDTPPTVIYSPGVEVDVFGLEPCHGTSAR